LDSLYGDLLLSINFPISKFPDFHNCWICSTNGWKRPQVRLELEVLNKHFGKHERKDMIRDESVKKKALHKVLLIDILMFLLLVPGLMPILTKPGSSNTQIYSVSGKVLMVEFVYESAFMSQLRQTRIYFHNGSMLVRNEISLEIGKYYRIWYKAKTLEVLRVEMLEKE